jgi:hypothetical protein
MYVKGRKEGRKEGQARKEGRKQGRNEKRTDVKGTRRTGMKGRPGMKGRTGMKGRKEGRTQPTYNHEGRRGMKGRKEGHTWKEGRTDTANSATTKKGLACQEGRKEEFV